MTELKVGDRVAVDLNSPSSSWHKAEGVVTATRDYPNSAKVRVTAAGPNDAKVIGEERTLWNLTKIEEPAFTYEDIQVGDKIRRTLTRETGTTEVREGTVVEKSELYALDGKPGFTLSANYILAYDSDGNPDKPQVVLELLDRPKPKHWTETKPVGSAAVYVDRLFTKIIRKTGEDEWTVVYADGYTYTSKNERLLTRFDSWDEAKLTWIK